MMRRLTQKDNSTEPQKIAIRKDALRRLAEWGVAAPVIMETHGGNGVLWSKCYAHLDAGCVFEKDDQKVARLARQRPMWSVYQADCEQALPHGVGGHLTYDLLDVDPYGSPWETLEGFFASARPFAQRMVVVVNDGLKIRLKLKGAWEVKILTPIVAKYGNEGLYQNYLSVCAELMVEKCSAAGYNVTHFGGYYCGANRDMSHYLATLERS